MENKGSQFSREFGQFVRTRRGGQIQEEFAAAVGISVSYLGRIERGLVPPADRIRQMAENLDHDAMPWLEAAGYTYGSPSDNTFPDAATVADKPLTAQLPLRGTLHGLELIPPETESVESILWAACLGAMPDYLIRVDGDSLYPLALPGDLLTVRETTTAKRGDLVVARAGDRTIVARYMGRRGTNIMLAPANQHYPVPPNHYELLAVVSGLYRSQETMRRFGR